MNKLSKSFKDEFNNIKINPKDDNKIYESIVNKKHSKHIILKLSTAVVVVLVFVFVGIANADTIKEKIKNSWIKHIFVMNEDGTKEEVLNYRNDNDAIEIIYDADYDEMNEEIFKNNCSRSIMQMDPYYDIEIYENPCYQFGSFNEFEETLGIKLIRSNMFKKDKLVITNLSKKDGKIASMSLDITNINGYEPKNYIPTKVYSTNKSFVTIDMKVGFYTKYYEPKVQEIPEGAQRFYGFSTRNNEAVDYYIKSLDTHAFILDRQRMWSNATNSEYKNKVIDVQVMFSKNNISYGFQFRGFDPKRDVVEMVEEFLDTLYLEDN